jgi:hypothetical protein
VRARSLKTLSTARLAAFMPLPVTSIGAAISGPFMSGVNGGPAGTPVATVDYFGESAVSRQVDDKQPQMPRRVYSPPCVIAESVYSCVRFSCCFNTPNQK